MYIAPITSALKLLRQSLSDDVRTACERRKMHDARDKNAVSETMKMYERYIIVAKGILAVRAMDAFPLATDTLEVVFGVDWFTSRQIETNNQFVSDLPQYLGRHC